MEKKFEPKWCPKCEKIKNKSDFSKNKNRKDGLQCWCKVCIKQVAAKYEKTEKSKKARSEYRKSEKGKEVGVRSSKKQMKEKPHRRWAASTLSFHRQKGNEILISIDELETKAKQTTHCEICGCELAWGYGKGYSANSPTLDRIDNGDIITLDNIQILCTKCNVSKSDRTMLELVAWCELVYKKFKKPDRNIAELFRLGKLSSVQN
jgi:hypothetical protein